MTGRAGQGDDRHSLGQTRWSRGHHSTSVSGTRGYPASHTPLGPLGHPGNMHWATSLLHYTTLFTRRRHGPVAPHERGSTGLGAPTPEPLPYPVALNLVLSLLSLLPSYPQAPLTAFWFCPQRYRVRASQDSCPEPSPGPSGPMSTIDRTTKELTMGKTLPRWLPTSCEGPRRGRAKLTQFQA